MIRHASLLCLFFIQVGSLSANEVTLQQRQERLTEALKSVQPAIVGVTDRIGFGSGVVVSGDGIVLTAAHVVESSHFRRRRSRQSTYVIFPDGREYECDVLGKNRSADAAMLKIKRMPADGSEFPHVTMGRSSEVSAGDFCFALGHPGGFRKDRPAPVRFGRVLSVGAMTIISDNAIVLGDSGGPLFDLDGRLIGIHSMITEVIVENRHVAIDVWHRDWDRLKNGDEWGRLRAFDNELAESDFFGTDLRWRHFTAEVRGVIRNGPADKAGIQPNDTLVSIDGQRFADRLELSTLLDQLEDGREVDVVLRRSDRERTVHLKTGIRPDDSDEPHSFGHDDDDSEDEDTKLELTLHRRVGPYEKRSPDQLKEFEPVVKAVKNSVVEIHEFGRSLALGTVMSRNGYILTKASELHRAVDPDCVFPDGSRRKFRRVAVDDAYDLALLKVDAADLTPVTWAGDDTTDPGRLVITTDFRGNPILPGVISVDIHTLQTASKPFLGIEPFPHSSGVLIRKVIAGGAAERSGLKGGDVVLQISGTEMKGPEQLVSHLQNYSPGDRIDVKVIRDNKIITVPVTLTGRFISEQNDALLPRYSELKELGKYASLHNSGFPEAFQHDTDLFPQQCGGPLLDASGNAIGINIARAARISSYAIPASAVQRVFEQLKKQDTESAL
ncbi:MAG: S1C family serine protease [Planctomycetaceae bacterium]